MEHCQSSKFKKANNEGKGTKLGPKVGVSKKLKFQGKCFSCGNQGHKFVDCRLSKRNKHKEVNVVDGITKDVSKWWINTSTTHHVCFDKKMFSIFELVETREKVFMGNSLTSKIKGQGKMVLKMMSRKELTLTNVLYVPEIRKNLVSSSLLNSHGFHMVFELDKFVLSKSGMCVRKGYMSDGMWKLNVNDYR